MKNYKYFGTSTLAFSYEGADYLAYGEGPHLLPEDSQLVKTLVAKKVLVAIDDTQTKVKQTNNI